MTINKVSNDTQVSMKKRIITAIFIALIGIPCLVLGDWFFLALVIFVTGVAVYEMLHITGKQYPWYIWVTTYIAVYTFVFWVFFQKINPIAEFYPDGRQKKKYAWGWFVSTAKSHPWECASIPIAML